MSIKQMLEDNKSQIVLEYNGGNSINQIAKRLNCNPGNIHLALQRWGVPIRTLGRGRIANIKDKIRILFLQDMTAYGIAKELGVRKSTVLQHLKRMGLSTSRFSDQREDPLVNHTSEIIQKYQNGISTNKLAEEYNTRSSSIWNLLKNNNIECRSVRTWSFDENFLDNIGEAQAYFLGWAFTDGNNRRDGFRLTICDKEILETFKDMLQYNGEIKEIKPKNENCKLQYSLELFGSKFSKRLTELGCIPAKTYILKWPKYIAENLVRPFIQGCLEGDGSISKTYVNFTGAKGLLIGIHVFLLKNFGIKCKWYHKRGTHKDIWSIFINRQVDMTKFLHWVYDTASIYLKRKYKCYKDLLESEKQEQMLIANTRERNKNIVTDHQNKMPVLQICNKYNVGKKTVHRLVKSVY